MHSPFGPQVVPDGQAAPARQEAVPPSGAAQVKAAPHADPLGQVSPHWLQPSTTHRPLQQLPKLSFPTGQPAMALVVTVQSLATQVPSSQSCEGPQAAPHWPQFCRLVVPSRQVRPWGPQHIP